MLKRLNKITSLLVAVVAVVSIVPTKVNAASDEKIKSEKGGIYNAIAYKDGKFYISGKPNKKDDAAYYLKDGNYSKLKDVDSEDKAEVYGTKYAEIDDGKYFVDLSNGDVTDKEVKNKELDNAAVDLRSKVKSDNDGRYNDDNAKSVKDLTELPNEKFSESWYKTQYDVKTQDEAVNGGEKTLNVYTNKDGKYIDADYNIGTVKVKLSNGETASIENTNDKDKDVRAKVTDAKVIGQDSNNIYRLATITVKCGTSGITIKEVNGIELTDSTTGYNSADKTNVSFKVIQVISKSQASKKIDGIKYAKTVSSYALSDNNGKKIDLLSEDEKSFTVADGKLINYKIDSSEVNAEVVNLKHKNSTYYVEIKNDDHVKLQDGENSVDTDAEGNLWALSDDNIYKFDNDENFDKIYETDKEYNSISVYNKENLVVWNASDEIFCVLGTKTETTDNGTTDTNTNANASTANTGDNASTVQNVSTAKAGWIQDNASKTWSYNNADGTKYKGWIGGSGAPWYYLDTNGIMLTGWQHINDQWYFLDKTSGAMQTGWLNDNGTWYYLNDTSGAMLSNTKVGIYKLGADGAWIK